MIPRVDYRSDCLHNKLLLGSPSLIWIQTPCFRICHGRTCVGYSSTYAGEHLGTEVSLVPECRADFSTGYPSDRIHNRSIWVPYHGASQWDSHGGISVWLSSSRTSGRCGPSPTRNHPSDWIKKIWIQIYAISNNLSIRFSGATVRSVRFQAIRRVSSTIIVQCSQNMPVRRKQMFEGGTRCTHRLFDPRELRISCTSLPDAIPRMVLPRSHVTGCI